MLHRSGRRSVDFGLLGLLPQTIGFALCVQCQSLGIIGLRLCLEKRILLGFCLQCEPLSFFLCTKSNKGKSFSTKIR
jgi:hypothetical protein